MTSQDQPLPAMTVPFALSAAREARLRADEAEGQAVQEARAAGWSWDRIGAALDVPGETLRRRYAAPPAPRPAPDEAPAAADEPSAAVPAPSPAPVRPGDRSRRAAARVRAPRGRSLGVQLVVFSAPRPPRGV